MVDAHVESGAGCTVAAIRQPIELADQFGVIDVDPKSPERIRAFLEKPKDPVGLPDAPARGARLDGQLRLRRRRAARGGDARRRAASGPSTTWAATSCRGSSTAPSRPSTTTRTTTCRGPTSATAATGATSGRCAPTTTPTWTWSRRCRCSTSTTTSGRSTRATGRSRRPSWSRATAGEPVTTFNSILSPGVVVTGGAVQPVGALAGLPRRDRGRGLRLGAAARACASAQARSCATRSSTRTSSSRRARRSASPRRTTGRAASWSRTG